MISKGQKIKAELTIFETKHCSDFVSQSSYRHRAVTVKLQKLKTSTITTVNVKNRENMILLSKDIIKENTEHSYLSSPRAHNVDMTSY